MIIISVSTDKQVAVETLIQKEFRLNELVKILLDVSPDADIIVNENISVLPDWQNRQAPVLYYDEPFSLELLLGLIYTKLGNFEKAYELLAHYERTLQIVDLLNCIQNGIELNASQLLIKDKHDFIAHHNHAIAYHYGFISETTHFNILRSDYSKAIQIGNQSELKAFTIKHYALLLSDANLLAEAEAILSDFLGWGLSDHICIELKSVLSTIWMKQLTVPYNTSLIEKIKDHIWTCLQYYESKNRTVDAALLLIDATHIATISNSFSEALGYISKAITIFDTEQVLELLAHAQLKKANLMQTWAQNNNPQFYRTAVTAYQAALKTFTKENTPEVFAEIHHQLGIVYSEIPDEVKKKSVWAAISVSSFNEALGFFTKNDYPYEFAMICNSFGNAYTKFPEAAKSDNFERALEWYWAALTIRTAEQYPLERVLTLSNYLEASWFAGNKTEYDEDRFNDMEEKAYEILSLTKDEALINQAKQHLEKLKQLKLEAEVEMRTKSIL
jgi:tetratricopeptide (TPR) repeat protein